MSDHWLDRARPRSSSGARVLTRLAVGGGLLAFGVVAMTQTTRFVPWYLWRSFWPLGIVAAGVLLLMFGGRSTTIAGVVLIGLGGLFLLSVAASLLWWIVSTLWPLALIFAGVVILAAAFRQMRGEREDEL